MSSVLKQFSGIFIGAAIAWLLIALFSAVAHCDLTAQGKYVIAKTRVDYLATPVTTSAWTEILSSIPFDATEIEIFDSSGQTLQLAFGPAGSEQAKLYIFPGGNGRVPLKVPRFTRVSIEAVGSSATAGYQLVNFWQ